MRKFVFAMIAAVLLVVTYDHFNAPEPKLISAPVHIFSEGSVRVCAEDKRDDAYQTKMTVSTGRLETVRKYHNTFISRNHNYIISGENEMCLMYTAPLVTKKTSMQLTVWQGKKKTDQAEVTLMPDRF